MFSLNPLTMVLSMNSDLMTTMAFRTFPRLTWNTPAVGQRRGPVLFQGLEQHRILSLLRVDVLLGFWLLRRR